MVAVARLAGAVVSAPVSNAVARLSEVRVLSGNAQPIARLARVTVVTGQTTAPPTFKKVLFLKQVGGTVVPVVFLGVADGSGNIQPAKFQQWDSVNLIDLTATADPPLLSQPVSYVDHGSYATLTSTTLADHGTYATIDNGNLVDNGTYATITFT